MTTLVKYPVAAAIQSRRTIKKFKTDPVSIDLIEELLDTAVWAPNHKLREPWRFIAFVEDGRQTLVQAIKHANETGKMGRPMKQEKMEHLLSIPAFVVVVMPEDPRPTIWEEDFAAVSALIQNFQLAAWERDLGVLWSTNRAIYSPEFRKATGIKPGEKVVGILQIGYPSIEPKPQGRTAAAERLTVVSDASLVEKATEEQ